VRLLRDQVRAVFPEAVESLDAQNLGFGFGSSYSQLVFVISPHKSRVNLGFARGASLPEPASMLEGKGKVHRHVKFRSEAQLERPELRDLMAEALERVHRQAGAQG
jgi:hypothetical protein